MDQLKTTEETREVDRLLSSVGLAHGQRKTLAGSWQNGERRARHPHLSQPDRRDAPAPAESIDCNDAPAPAESIDCNDARGKSRRSGEAPPAAEASRSIESVRAPGWQSYSWLRHGFSTRSGGVSSVYSSGDGQDRAGQGSLNMGWTGHDKASNVTENRRRFIAEVAGRHAPASRSRPSVPASTRPGPCLLTLRQFHSGMLRVMDAGDRDHPARWQTSGGHAVLRGDGMMTDAPGVFLGIQTADCVPVLVADLRLRAVAAFHAGWRGTLARIVERGIGTMRLRYGSRPRDLVAVVGPSIGPCCYAVGEELRFQFESQFAYAPQLFTEVCDSAPVRDKYPLLFLTARAPGHSNIGPQAHLDLWQANRRQLLDAGIPAGRIAVIGECTACAGVGTTAGRKYFSHRAESGFTGRMMAVIGVADD